VENEFPKMDFSVFFVFWSSPKQACSLLAWRRFFLKVQRIKKHIYFVVHKRHLLHSFVLQTKEARLSEDFLLIVHRSILVMQDCSSPRRRLGTYARVLKPRYVELLPKARTARPQLVAMMPEPGHLNLAYFGLV